MPLTKLNSASVIERLPTGSVLQTKKFQLTVPQVETYSTAQSNQAISNFNVTITPNSTSSIIKLEAYIIYETANVPWDTMWFFYRDSTKLGATGSIGNRRSGIAISASSHSRPDNVNTTSTPEFATVTYFDEPLTTSSITYKLGVNSSSTNSFKINRTGSDADSTSSERGVSFIMAQEIKG